MVQTQVHKGQKVKALLKSTKLESQGLTDVKVSKDPEGEP